VASVIALCTTLMILATQAREDEAARRRSQLTLQLASLSEQKIAKVISLLEEQRRDNPQLETRSDPQADAMSEPADPGHVLDRIEDTHQDGCTPGYRNYRNELTVGVTAVFLLKPKRVA
jgi:uncharacterized membrane protein